MENYNGELTRESAGASPRDQEGYDGDRELPPVATGFRDRDPVAT